MCLTSGSVYLIDLAAPPVTALTTPPHGCTINLTEDIASLIITISRRFRRYRFMARNGQPRRGKECILITSKVSFLTPYGTFALAAKNRKRANFASSAIPSANADAAD